MNKPRSRTVRKDGYIFYANAWRSPEGFENALRAMREKDKRRDELRTKRRNYWIYQHGPCSYCFSWQNLEIDYIEPRPKPLKANQLFGMSEDTIAKTLAECHVLCHSCHLKKIKGNTPTPR